MPKSKLDIKQCETLHNLEAPGYLQEFHDASVGSISMMAGTFTGIANALKQQNGRSDEIEARLSSIDTKMNDFFQSIQKTQNRVETLAKKTEESIGDIDKRFANQEESFDEKLHSQAEDIKEVINENSKRLVQRLTRDTKQMIAKVESSVKNTANTIKTLEKAITENKNSITLAKQKVDDAKKSIQKTRETLMQSMTELNNYVSRETTKLKEEVEAKTNGLVNTLQELEKGFKTFQFDTSQRIDRKADVEDLDRKLGKIEFVSKFEEFKHSLEDAAEEKENMIQELQKQLQEESSVRSKLDDECHSSFATSETDRRQMHQEIDRLKSLASQDPVTMIQQAKQDILDYVDQEDAIIREKMKSLGNNSSAAGPAFGSQDGMCFSCGKGPSSGMFPPMPERFSPSKSAMSGGFKMGNSPIRKKSMHQRSKSLRTLHNINDDETPRAPPKMNESNSLPQIRRTLTENSAISNKGEEIHLPDVNQKGPGSSTIAPYVGIQRGSVSPKKEVRMPAAPDSIPVSRGSNQ